MPQRQLPSTITLQCFEAAARHLSFTRAAEELSLTQSAISKQVAQLETLLQHKLFRRLRRSLVLTPEGSLYVSEVRKILAQIAMSTSTILTYSGHSDVLRVATLPTFGTRWLARHLPAFLDARPHLTLDLSERVETFDLTREGIDVAIFHGHGNWPNLDCHKLFDEQVLAVGSPRYVGRHHLAAQHLATHAAHAERLTAARLLHLSTRPDAWHRWFAAHDIHSESSYHGTRVETFHTLIRLAMADGGLALIPRFLIHQELADGDLVSASPHVLTGPDAYYLVTPEPLGELSKVRGFCDHLLACAGRDGATG
ncbi:LysR substrate-binding domain-containing protein [Halomonas sp. V046]|uniref:LysR substrate-binding domain-containing protein n=1 Tax=Halomonas sp. V046 TaxID=3459611 RepID=UPI0040442248